MKEFFKNIFKFGLSKGLRIGYSTGKMFDPTDQERTDAVKDLVKQDEEKTKTMLDKMFKPVKKKKGE